MQLRCIGGLLESCQKCKELGIKCVKSGRDTSSLSPRAPNEKRTTTSRGSYIGMLHVLPQEKIGMTDKEGDPVRERLGRVPDFRELDALVHLYFSSAHRAYYILLYTEKVN
jgi:hypothetical protein